MVALVGIVWVCSLGWTHDDVDSRGDQLKRDRGMASEDSAPTDEHAMSFDADHTRRLVSTAGEEEASRREIPKALIELLGPSLGDLSGDDAARVISYLDPLQESAHAELETFRSSQGGETLRAEDLAREATLLRSAVLWSSAVEAFRRGDYWLGRKHPNRLPSSEHGVHYQDFSVLHDGEAAAIVIFIRDDTRAGIELSLAKEYNRDQGHFLMREAARRFNSMPHHERERLFWQYREADEGRPLGEELRHIFPRGVRVNPENLIMYVPR